MDQLHVADTIVIILYLALTLGAGVYAGRRIGGLEEYAVAGRSYGSWIVFATLSASFIGGGFTIGNAEKVFLAGVASAVALWGFSLKEVLVATFIAPRVGSFPNAISVGDVMERDFGKMGKFVTGVFSLLLCAGILGAQVGGIGIIFNVFLGVPAWLGILLGAGIVIAYSTVGGMKAVVATDVLQFGVLVVGIPLVLVFGVFSAGGVGAVAEGLPAGHLTLFSNTSPLAFGSLFLTFLLGETLVPPYVLRLFVGKNAEAVSKGTLWSGLLSIPFFAVVGGVGLVAAVLMPGLSDATLVLPSMIKEVLPVGLRGMVVAGVIAVVMSSADSFLNAASIALVNDVIQPLRRDGLDDASRLLLARAATLITGALAVFFAIRIASVLDILIYAYHFWAPVILVPLAATLMGWRSNKRAFAGGAAAGLAGVFLWRYAPGAAGEIDGLVVGVFANLLTFALICFVTIRARADAPGPAAE